MKNRAEEPPGVEPCQIQILDTTLRDGQQCPGAGMSREKNLAYARLAAAMGVDVLEAGFPSASAIEFQTVRAIAEELAGLAQGPKVCGLSQLRPAQIDKTLEALSPAISSGKARIHIYLPVDPVLLQASLKKDSRETRSIASELHESVRRASQAGVEVQLGLEGYSSMGNNWSFATDLIRAALGGGAKVILCADTLGLACRRQGKDYLVCRMNEHASLMAKEFADRSIIWGVHCHNDFGLALENTMSAVFEGPARQIEGCINGIGERAGNASLEQCIMYLKHFGCLGATGSKFGCRANPRMLKLVSDFVAAEMLPRQPHWPITGDNAARHSSGGHTNAILKTLLAYQPFDPREVGSRVTLVFGPSSGGNHLQAIVRRFGYPCEDSEKATIAQFVKAYYSDRRKGITDEELIVAYLEYRRREKNREGIAL